MKTFRIIYNVGKSKYVVNYNNGQDKHPDGSPFYHIQIFKNKKLLNKFINELKQNKYIQN